MKDRRGSIALVVMLLADIVLVAWALGLVGGGEPRSERSVRSSATSSTTATPSSPEPSPESEGSTVLLDAAGATHALRATYLPCSTEGPAAVEVERTTDGGATWQASEVAARSVLRVRLTSESEGFAVVADEECEPRVVTTADGGETWGEPGPAVSTWGLWPEPGPEVLVPGGRPATACDEGDAVAISATDGSEAFVLCGDAAVRRTSDAGKTWTDAATVKDALSVSARGDRVAVLVDTDGCDGLGVRSGERAQELALGEPACVEGVSAPAAIAVTGEAGWVSGGSTTEVGAEVGR